MATKTNRCRGCNTIQVPNDRRRCACGGKLIPLSAVVAEPEAAPSPAEAKAKPARRANAKPAPPEAPEA